MKPRYKILWDSKNPEFPYFFEYSTKYFRYFKDNFCWWLTDRVPLKNMKKRVGLNN